MDSNTKNITLIIFLVHISIIAFCQEKYFSRKDAEEVLFLGAYNENRLKVLKGNKIEYIDKNDLSQIDQLSSELLMKAIKRHHLFFIFEGTEPFWEVQLDNKIIKFKPYTEGMNEVVTEIDFVFDKQPGFVLMFNSKDKNVYGLIKRVDYRKQEEESCDLASTDDNLVYEIYLSVNNDLFKGCGSIDVKK